MIINLNKIYAGTKPSIEYIRVYYERVRELLPSELKELDIVIEGTGPVWLFLKIVIFLQPFVRSITIRVGDINYEVFHSSEKKLLSYMKQGGVDHVELDKT